MTAIGSVTTYLMNQILLAFSTTASAVYGVYFKLNSFFFMPLFGLNNAVVPIVAYNYGARNRGRIHQAIRTSTITAVTIMLLGWAAFFFLPVPLLRLFDASEAMIAIGIPAFRITSFTYPLAAVSIVASSVFQALGKSIYSMLVSLGRQLIVLIPVAYLFSLTGVLDDVWLAFPIAEVVCLISSLFFLKKSSTGWMTSRSNIYGFLALDKFSSHKAAQIPPYLCIFSLLSKILSVFLCAFVSFLVLTAAN